MAKTPNIKVEVDIKINTSAMRKAAEATAKSFNELAKALAGLDKKNKKKWWQFWK